MGYLVGAGSVVGLVAAAGSVAESSFICFLCCLLQVTGCADCLEVVGVVVVAGCDVVYLGCCFAADVANVSVSSENDLSASVPVFW